MLKIRPENSQHPEELAAIRAINLTAFGPIEADLVDQLRAGSHVLLSLVADLDGALVGHILFTRMWIDGPPQSLPAVALAPVAVLPDHQRRGIGSTLVQDGIDAMRARNEAILFVLGHPGYYPKFGFSAALAAAIESPFPGDAFMALELQPGALSGVSGRVRYAEPFGL